MKEFIGELKRRKVFKIAAVYLVVGWLLMQVADVMFPALGLPSWTVTLVAALYILGFPVALILSWLFELGPGGLQRDSESACTTATTMTPAVREDSNMKSVAVLPFLDMSPGRDQDYFSDGLTEELLNVLAQLPDLRVASRTSCFAFKHETMDVPEIATRLGVGYIVEGSVRKAGERLRITAQLIESASDSHLWSATYDRDLDDVFEIQENLARKIADALQVKLLPRDLPKPSTENVEAYERFLRGRSYFNRLGKLNLYRAIEMYRNAVQLDPQFSRAWAALALTYAYRVLYFRTGADELTCADEASNRAIELDPEIADGYVARIMVCAAAGRGDEAERSFSKAVQLDPGNFSAYYHFGRFLYKQGDMKRALTMFERAREIDPGDYQTPLVSVSIYRSRGDEKKARLAARLGIRAVEAHLDQHPDDARANMLAATAYRYLGDMDKALQRADLAMQLDPDSEDTQYNGACFYANAGEIEKALDCLERGVLDPDWMDNDSDLDPLRDHPRFEAIMTRMRESCG